MEIHKIICDYCKEQEKNLKNPSFSDLREWQYLNNNKHFCSFNCLYKYLNEKINKEKISKE